MRSNGRVTHESAVGQLLAEIVKATARTDLSPRLTPDPVRAGEIVAALTPVVSADPVIDWVGVNGARVDIGIVSSSGQEWRVVCSIDATGVHSARVFERPKPFLGIEGGRAVIVDGPSSAGKTTVMNAVLDRSSAPWVMFDEPFFGLVRSPFLIWPEASPTLRAGFLAGIAALAAAGNQVIMATGGLQPETFRPISAGVPTLWVGLSAPLDVRIARQSGRADRWGGLTESHDSAAPGWTYDLSYDTAKVSAIDIAEDILARTAIIDSPGVS